MPGLSALEVLQIRVSAIAMGGRRSYIALEICTKRRR
jgi:hypothetical protein